ncbi:MAG TPA: hypothetical protein PJ990_16325 [Saprospiraceae bacterium]|nr:hypothetical protein [Saprospiraceae bacterium]
MNFYHLSCEVPGGIGAQTVYDKTKIPWELKHLHLRFDGWLGGEILTAESAVVVSLRLSRALGFHYSGIVGYQHFFLEKTETFTRLQSNTELPKFERIMIDHKIFIDDFALGKYKELHNQLIISENVRVLLNNYNLGNYRISKAEY